MSNHKILIRGLQVLCRSLPASRFEKCYENSILQLRELGYDDVEARAELDEALEPYRSVQQLYPEAPAAPSVPKRRYVI